MEKYKYFNDNCDYEQYLNSLDLKRIGSGREGIAFLTNENTVIKRFVGSWFDPATYEENDKSHIIMAEDYNVSTYLFPKQLLILDKIIVGYVTDYFPNNIIKCCAPYNGKITDINTDNLLRAYYEMVRDTEEISKGNVMVYDLTFNILFDNYRLGAVDTFNYYINSSPTLDENLKALDYSILHELHYHDYRFESNYDESIEENLKRIKKY